MKLISEQEIEIRGEEYGHVIATFMQDQGALRIRLIVDGEGYTALLDAHEASQLSDFLEASVPRRGARVNSLTFANEANDTMMSFYPDNMGEPFREGISVSLRPIHDHGAHVFMEEVEAGRFRKFASDVVQLLQASGPKP